MITVRPVPVGLVGLVGELRRRPLQAPTVNSSTVKAARKVWGSIRAEHGMRNNGASKLLSAPGSNVKVSKSVRLVYGLNLSPAMSSGLYNTCVRFADCESVCVLTDARGSWASVKAARAARTALLYRAPEAFAIILASELAAAALKAGKAGREWGVRLNVGSDIPWELVAPWTLELVRELGGVAYDYTKAWSRTGTASYSITRSADSRHGVAEISQSISAGVNVAVVLPIRKGKPVPTSWNGLPAIDGDVTDDRTTDPRGVVVILRGKGKLRGVAAGAHPLVKAL